MSGLFVYGSAKWHIIGSGGGISPLPSHRTVRESLPSHGSSCSRRCEYTHGWTNFQCSNKPGVSLY